ncbi:MAG: GHKL domain-containing protein [Candidatus Omnitrophica bacterium]|nr:GHKL domain-containing protein [Candidatus Omnitrophota bacterium]
MAEIFLARSYFFNPYAIPYAVASFLMLALGIFVYSQNRKGVINLAYLSVCLSASLWLFGDFAIISSAKEISAHFCAKFVYIGITLIPPSLYFFSSAWLGKIAEKKRWILLNYLLGAIFISSIFFTDHIVNGYQRHFYGNFSRLDSLGFIYLAYFFGVSLVFFKDLLRDYLRESDPFKKIHKKRIIIAFSIGFMGAVDFLPTYGVSIYPLGFLSILLLNVIIAHTIIRYKLMDIETVIHKTIAWFFTNLAIVIPFILLGYSIRGWYATLNFWPALAVLVALAMIFLFLVKLLQPRVDHFFQRRRFDLEGVLSHFIEEIIRLKNLRQLIELVESTIADSLYPQSVDIFIFDENEKDYRLSNTKYACAAASVLRGDNGFLRWLAASNKIAQRESVLDDPRLSLIKNEADEYFNSNKAVLVIPLVLNERLLGVIHLGRKANFKLYSPADFFFLNNLRNQASVALSNSLLYKNIEEEVRQRTKELVEVQRQLIQAEKLATMGTLAGGVAHEINNPLTAVLTNVQMLLSSEEIRDTNAKESLALIEEATKRCRSIIKKLMTYAKKPFDSAQDAEADLLKAVNSAVSFLSYQLGQENINIVVYAPKDFDYRLVGNQNELEQVITNIVLNAKDAIKQIKDEGDISIRLQSREGRLELAVEDEGIGMSKDVLAKIFDPFFTTKEVGKGTGLGLSICQSIVEKHKGKINVRSEPGKGTVISITFPQA